MPIHTFVRFVAPASLSLALLSGCVSDSPDSSSGGDGRFSVEAEAKVLDIQAPTDSTAGVIETESVEYECEGSQVVADTSIDDQNYVVSGGNLYLWEEGECSALKLSGSSSTVIGKWSGSGLFGADSIPVAYRPAGCEPDSGDDDLDFGLDSLFQDLNVSYDISETTLKGKISGKICMGGLLASAYAGAGGPFQVTASDCGSATLKNSANGKSLKISTRFENNEIKVTMSSSGKSCSYSEEMELSNKPPVCPEPDRDAEEEAFEECQSKLAFFQGMDGLDKRASGKSAPAIELVKSVQSSLRGL